MKHKSILFAVLIASQLCYAQYKDNEDQAAPVQDITRVTFLSPGFSYEKSIGKKFSVLGHAFLSPSFAFQSSSSLGTKAWFYLDPTLDIFLRYYYNGNKRAEAGKKTSLNNMNYIAAVGEFIASKRPIADGYESSDTRVIKNVGAVWGLQRNFPGRFSLDFSIGLGVLFAETTFIDDTGFIYWQKTTRLTSLGQFTMGFWLNKR